MVSLAELITRKSMSYAQSLARPYAEGAMNSLVLITRNGGFDEAAGEYNPGLKATVYDDVDFPTFGAKAGVTMTTGPITVNYGDEPEYLDNIQVMIPKSAPGLFMNPRIDDIVRIMANPDASLWGRFYRVQSVVAGGRISTSNTLLCSGAAPSKQWVS